jgi:hypothetical protein
MGPEGTPHRLYVMRVIHSEKRWKADHRSTEHGYNSAATTRASALS